jgi:hypothetical protein
MFDDIVAANVPAGGDLYLGYDDGAWPDAAALAARFPDVPVVRMTTSPRDNEGDGLDVEKGDANPVDGPPWLVRRRASGCWWAFLYCNSSTWPSVEAAVAAAGLTGVRYGIAQYDNDPTIPADWIARGCVFKQYAGGPTASYDISSVLDVWPGIDRPITPPQEASMNVTLGPNGELYIAAASPANHLLLFSASSPGASWSVIDVTDKIQAEAPGQPPYLVQP